MCSCLTNPMASKCGVFDGNVSACVCVEDALQGSLPS
jgi:hypothetical protein